MILNNKGQSLVLFIIIIPIILGIMAIVIDIGNIIYENQELDNINRIVLDYGLDSITDRNIIDNMKNLAYINKDNIDVDIKFIDNEFYIESSYYVKGIFSNIFNIEGYLVKSKYKGYIGDDNKNIIKEIK